jgi:hypothetical protein
MIEPELQDVELSTHLSWIISTCEVVSIILYGKSFYQLDQPAQDNLYVAVFHEHAIKFHTPDTIHE